MGEHTKIEWCDHTFNPWRGCSKVAAGCANCYAERQAKRNPKAMGTWGPEGTRVNASETAWKQPVRWNRKASRLLSAWAKGVELHGGDEAACVAAGYIQPQRPRVFCGSMCDVFEDRPDLEAPRRRLFDMIYRLTALDWLILTKRPDVAYEWIGGSSGAGLAEWPVHFPSHVWLGFSASTQADLDRGIPQLFECPAAVRFLSLEPLLEPIDLQAVYGALPEGAIDCNYGESHRLGQCNCQRGVDWVIVGGESGPRARPCNVAWVRSIVQQCRATGVPCFSKQLGRRVVGEDWVYSVEDSKGANPEEWPEDLRVRDFPT